MSNRIEFDEQQTEVMRNMRRMGKSWVEVAERFGCSTATVRRHMGFVVRRGREAAVGWKHLNLEPPQVSRVVPDCVIADRDRRLAVAPRDLTAELFGDPKPGWSALDRQ